MRLNYWFYLHKNEKLYRIEHLKRLLNQRTNEAVTAALQAREAPKWVFFSSKVIYLTTEIDIVY